MKDGNEHKKIFDILWISLFFISLFLLSYYKYYALLAIWLAAVIFIIVPKIKK